MSSWSSGKGSPAAVRDAIAVGDRRTAELILAENHGLAFARDVLRSLSSDITRAHARASTRPPAEA